MSTPAALEAILLMATEPTITDELAAALDLTVDEAERELEAIAAFYEDNGRGISCSASPAAGASPPTPHWPTCWRPGSSRTSAPD